MSEIREFLMLAQPYKEKKHKIKGWLMSEKMDGIRVLWDGGISRGLSKREIPWANNDKDERYVEEQISTGLWTRYGNLIHAPDWFLDQLPDYPLDGELWTDRRRWQRLSSIIKRLVPDDKAWEEVTYNVFDAPPYGEIFKSGRTGENPNFKKTFDVQALMDWARPRIKINPRYLNFAQVSLFLENHYGDEQFENIRPVKQTLVENDDHLIEEFTRVLDLGGEGLIVRNPKSYWEPKRSHQEVKIKADNDDEGTVIGYIWGRKTDKGSKLLGLMGALVLDYNGKRLELSGFTDEQRQMENHTYDSTLREDEGYIRPGQPCSSAWFNRQFRIGERITFKYRELSDTGIPKEARYHRKRNSE